MSASIAAGLHPGFGFAPLRGLWTPSATVVAAWYNRSSTAVADGIGATTLSDLSDNGRDLSELADNVSTPIARDGYIEMPINTGYLSSYEGFAHPLNIFYLMRARTYDGTQSSGLNYIFDSGGPNDPGDNIILLRRFSATEALVSSNSTIDANYPIADDELLLYNAQFATGNRASYKNATVRNTDASSVDTGSFGFIFGGRQLSGSTANRQAAVDLYEFIAVPGALPVATRQLYEGYITHNNSATSLLPSGHPYKLSPP